MLETQISPIFGLTLIELLEPVSDCKTIIGEIGESEYNSVLLLLLKQSILTNEAKVTIWFELQITLFSLIDYVMIDFRITVTFI